MDIKPVTRKSVTVALLWWLLYSAVIVLIVRWSNGGFSPVFLWGAGIILGFGLLVDLLAYRARIHRAPGLEIITYGARSQGSLTLDVPVAEVPPLVEAACRDSMELGLRQLGPDGGMIDTGPSFSAWGERIRFAVQSDHENGSRLLATCRPRFSVAVVNWGRTDRLMREFLSGVQQAAASQSVTLPQPMS
ncbi:hypothetical protein [Kocuria tytonis]|uniref:DUF1499 domain-containing protein n=1 Tax=Kocuria tytonis TaxID=2054280 RepID=A0A495AB17_9MICC|nr:hypothetical protein [Kocuria tytonis]RKQ37052.1 hypothetical protein C1C97_005585 [Kocuria tytonis]